MQRNAIGIIYKLKDALERGAEPLVALGAECVQLQCWDPALYTRENAEKLKKMFDGTMRISSLWAGWTGPCKWNFGEGPHTLGLVPTAYRYARMGEIAAAFDFATWLGVSDVATHVGFIPENPTFEEYQSLLCALRDLVKAAAKREIHFNFETGQETPVTLMRMITDLNSDYVGINLDPANLILYGKGNPVDALGLFRGKIRGVHLKDGDYPTEYYSLGKERVVGEGSVNFPVFLPRLIADGYRGDLYIEREISGEQQLIDIRKTMEYAKGILENLS